MQTDNPLVSIIIITYNSSKFIIETLESAKAQTYKNIELIISDDCSKDNTVELCQKWLTENKKYFLHTELIQAPSNTGIVANNNRGLKVAKGEWIKFIAGDDILMENCIEDFVDYTKKNKLAKIVFGRFYFLKDSVLEENLPSTFFSLCYKEQFREVFKGAAIPAPAAFISRALMLELGGFDENYKYIEDFPLWIAIARKKIYFDSINSFVVKYRLHDMNITRPGKNFLNELYYRDNKKLIMQEVIPELIKQKEILSVLDYLNQILIYELIILLGNNNNVISKMINLCIISGTYNRISKRLRLLKRVRQARLPHKN